VIYCLCFLSRILVLQINKFYDFHLLCFCQILKTIKHIHISIFRYAKLNNWNFFRIVFLSNVKFQPCLQGLTSFFDLYFPFPFFSFSLKTKVTSFAVEKERRPEKSKLRRSKVVQRFTIRNNDRLVLNPSIILLDSMLIIFDSSLTLKATILFI